MPTGSWQLDALRICGLVVADALLLAGMWLLWAAHRRAEGERVLLPLVGRVSVPTCLTLALCLLAAGYHALAYSVFPKFTLWAVPVQRWWVVVGAVVAAGAGALALERLERTEPRGDGGPASR